MADYTLGRIVPEKLVPIFSSTNPYSCEDITGVMSKVFSGFQEWDYLGNISNGLIITCKSKPTKSQIQTLFNRVEQLLEHYPVLDKSDEITYEEFRKTIEREIEKDEMWIYGEGYYYTKLHQRHTEKMFFEEMEKVRSLNKETA